MALLADGCLLIDHDGRTQATDPFLLLADSLRTSHQLCPGAASVRLLVQAARPRARAAGAPTGISNDTTNAQVCDVIASLSPRTKVTVNR